MPATSPAQRGTLTGLLQARREVTIRLIARRALHSTKVLTRSRSISPFAGIEVMVEETAIRTKQRSPRTRAAIITGLSRRHWGSTANVHGHEKIPKCGQLEVPTRGQLEVPTPL